ncbi:hypothetical protein KWH04_15890 [Xanthomonas campestris pv. trichodesmae]|uniref:hypothetical protein n=1 Tax=Xanthomonas citri TaxID=346 RepID=UPI0012FE634B|nr:hypothetical protein [Xanthomonas citri]MBV6782092.1 hypothetical protein [Xanthomonas campestris pv. trichodesmae]
MASHIEAKKAATELVKAALESGWLNEIESGEMFAREVGDAISALKKRLVQIQDEK